MDSLTPLQQDTLQELFNVGVGQAAAMMSRMVDEEIVFDVPRVELLSRKDVAEQIYHKAGAATVCSVTERFYGVLEGEALLMFPQVSSLEIVRLMVGRQIPLEELSALEADAMSEVGNILLNACMSSLSEMLGDDFDCDLPETRAGSPYEVLCASPDYEGDPILFLHISFAIERRAVDGYIAFLLDEPAVAKMRGALEKFLSAMTV